MDKIAYVSPLNPVKSGISDYSEELIPALSRHYDIEIYIPNDFKPTNQSLANYGTFRKFHELPARYATYKTVLYHMGNNYEAHHDIYDLLVKFPGIVVLHDFSLHHFFAQKTLEMGDQQAYLNEMLYCHGMEGLEAAEKFLKGKSKPPWESQSLKYPLNLRVLDHAAAVIVHSKFAKEKIEEQTPFVPVFEVPMPARHIIEHDQADEMKKQARRALGLKDDEIVISTLGYVNPTKRVDKILAALGQLKKEKKIPSFKFVIVGQISEDYPVHAYIKKNGLQDDVICTGFVSLEQFETYIAASDFCINLRYPTQGESSASLLRILGYGKPVIVTDVGSFSDFELDYVIKIPYDDEEIKQLMKAIDQFAKRSLTASEFIMHYVRINHSLERVASDYKRTIDTVLAENRSNVMIVVNNYLEKLAKRTMVLQSSEIFDIYVERTAANIANTFLNFK